jgi:hypothetical protein
MRNLSKSILFAVLAAASLCASAKTFSESDSSVTQEQIDAALGAPTFTLDVKWVRADSPVAEFRDGTCYVYVGETFGRESSLYPMGALLEQCVAKGAHVVNAKPIDGARRIAVHLAPNMDDMFAVTRMIDAVLGTGKAILVGRGLNMRFVAAPKHLAGGVYFDPDGDKGGTCTVVGFRWALGHEVKHCFDGEFHDEHWNWLKKN